MINVWLAVRPTIKAEAKGLREAPRKGDEALTDDQARLFGKGVGDVATMMRRPRLDGLVRELESLYVDSIADIEELVKGGAIVLGAWNWDGSRLPEYPLHPRLNSFMPPRFQTNEKEETEEVEDDTLRDVNLVWGQGERDFG